MTHTPTILVTGGAGYVGSHVCKALAENGFQPVTFDNLSRGFEKLVKWGELVVGDIRDRDALDRALRDHRPDAICHMAALAYVGESVENPGLYYDNNVVGSLTLAQAAVAAGVPHIVFSSTCAVYGEPTQVPITEDHARAPVNPYGTTKLTVERLLGDFDRAHGLTNVCLRYFNAAGADPDGEIGECHDPETHALPLAIQAALGGKPFRVFGTDYPTPDGTAIRDYVHVADLGAAHVRALQYLLAGNPSTALNLGTGRGTSVLELLHAVEQSTGAPVPYGTEARRPGDPPILYADPGRAEEVLDWRCRFTEFGEIVDTAVAWHRGQ